MWKVPVACKACPCGHSFFNARRNSIKSPPSPELGAMKTRRTNRVKREKPNYYDSLEFEKQSRKSAKVKFKQCLSFFFNQTIFIFKRECGITKLKYLFLSW